MKYIIENCSIYSESIINESCPVYIFENHNMALPAWGSVSCKSGERLHLISFDTHTDTLPPFNQYLHSENQNCEDGLNNRFVRNLLKNCKYKKDEFCFEDVFGHAIEDIKNTEQIKTAYQFGYLRAYTIIHKLDADGYEEYDRYQGYDCKYFQWPNVDWDYLYHINDPIMLDFDLDYFHTLSEMDTAFERNITPIIAKAYAITIAKEPYYFNALRMEEGFSIDNALKRLLTIICNARK